MSLVRPLSEPEDGPLARLRVYAVVFAVLTAAFAGVVATNTAAASGVATVSSSRVFSGGCRRSRCVSSNDLIWVRAGRSIAVDYKAEIAEPRRRFAEVSIRPWIGTSGPRADVWVGESGQGTVRTVAQSSGLYEVAVEVDSMQIYRSPFDITLRWRVE